MQWLYGLTHDKIRHTPQQKRQINSLLEEYGKAAYPKTITEHRFLCKFKHYKQFVGENLRLPSSSKEPELYQWFQRATVGFPSFQDQRRDYFKDLCEHLRSEGFDVNLNP